MKEFDYFIDINNNEIGLVLKKAAHPLKENTMIIIVLDNLNYEHEYNCTNDEIFHGTLIEAKREFLLRKIKKSTKNEIEEIFKGI